MTEPRKPITIRLNPNEFARYQSAAREKGLTVSAWLRMAGLNLADAQDRERRKAR
jgi:2,4-dienoyl-CoA reductase-like NADH-dependent reductase (Old Yellow Enzyme family)